MEQVAQPSDSNAYGGQQGLASSRGQTFVYRRSSSGTRAAFGDFSPVEDLSVVAELSAVAGWIMSVRDACFTGSRLAALAVP